MPTAREVNQKLSEVTVGWHSLLGEAHRLLNEVETQVRDFGNIGSSLAIPTPYQTKEQQISYAITRITDTQRRATEAIAKLREFLRV